MIIKYGFHEYDTNKLYKISKTCEEPKIAGKRCWVLKIIRWFGNDMLEVLLSDGTKWQIKPLLVINEN